MGQSIAGQLNQLPIDMQGNVLNGQPTNTGGAQYGATQMGSPGMGGKGSFLDPFLNVANGVGAEMSGMTPEQFNQQALQPMDQSTMDQAINSVSSMGGLPPAPNAQVPLGRVSGGTPGRPSASAPMVPRGVGFANPGAPGAPQQNPQFVSPTVQAPRQPVAQPVVTQPQRPLTGNFQPRPIGNLSPQPLGKPPVVGQITKPNKGIGITYGPLQKGAGRGGILR